MCTHRKHLFKIKISKTSHQTKKEKQNSGAPKSTKIKHLKV